MSLVALSLVAVNRFAASLVALSLGLAAPLWLLGLLGLLAPLVLHLLARGRGRRVRVGSVRLLADSPPRRPRRLQLQRPLLLALRCLLLALVALALAGPRLRREAAAAAAPRAWVLVEPGVDAEAIDAVRGAVAAGAEVRLLATGMPRSPAKAGAAAVPDIAAGPGGLWSLLREAAAAAPAGTRFLVVTSGRLAALRGERPAFPNAVEWHEVPDARPNRWLARALTSETGPALLLGYSDRARTIFTIEAARGGAQTRDGGATGDRGVTSDGHATPGGGVTRDAGVPQQPGERAGRQPGEGALAGGDAVPDDDRAPTAAPSPVRVAVLAAADRRDDARYVRAALAAAAEAAGLRLDASPAGADTLPATVATAAVADATAHARPQLASTEPAPALTFWLADAPPPPPVLDVIRAGGALVTDGGSPEESCRGSVVIVATSAPVQLHRCGGDAASRSAPVPAPAPQRASWVSDSGRAVLWEQSLGRGRWLRFASRFHPAWSELVLSPAFPEWLRDLLRAAAGGDVTVELPVSDRRADGGQGKPATTARRRSGPATASPAPASPGPERAAWLLLFPLLLAERWLATRR